MWGGGGAGLTVNSYSHEPSNNAPLLEIALSATWPRSNSVIVLLTKDGILH